jgi:hypothetical protein
MRGPLFAQQSVHSKIQYVCEWISGEDQNSYSPLPHSCRSMQVFAPLAFSSGMSRIARPEGPLPARGGCGGAHVAHVNKSWQCGPCGSDAHVAPQRVPRGGTLCRASYGGVPSWGGGVEGGGGGKKDTGPSTGPSAELRSRATTLTRRIKEIAEQRLEVRWAGEGR